MPETPSHGSAPTVLDSRIRGAGDSYLQLSWTPPHEGREGRLTLSSSDSDARLELPAPQIAEARQVFSSVADSLRTALQAAIELDADADRSPEVLARGDGLELMLIPIGDRWRVRIRNERAEGVGILLSSHEFSRFTKQLDYFRPDDPYESIRFADMADGGMKLPDPDSGREISFGRSVLLAMIMAPLGFYGRGAFAIPALLAAFTQWVLKKRGPKRSETFFGAAAVQVGHALWMILGLIILRSFGQELADPLVQLALVAWLLWRPGIISASVVLLFQIGLVAYTIPMLQDHALFSEMHRAVTVHLALRLAAIGLTAYGLYQLRKQAPKQNSDPQYEPRAGVPG